MPAGIIMQSGSVAASEEETRKNMADVFERAGLEPETPEEEKPAELVEPKREDFESDDAFEEAQEAYEAAQEEAEVLAAEEARKKAEAAGGKKSRLQRRVEKATKALQEDLRKANERLAALEGKGGTKAAETKVEAPKVPKREDFKSDEEFEDAKFDYRYKLRRAKEQADEAARNMQERLTQSFEEYKTSVAAFKEEHDDWDDVVNDDKVRIPEHVYYAIADLGKGGPPVTYYLATHPDFLAKIWELTPFSAVMEIARLSDKLKGGAARSGSDGAPEKKTPPKKIPEPIKPVSTAATASTLTSRAAAEKGDFKAFKAAQRRGA